MNTKKRGKYLAVFIVAVTLSGCLGLNKPIIATPTSVIHQKNNTTPSSIPISSPVSETVPFCRGSAKPILATNKSGVSGTIIYQNDNSTGLYTLGGTPLSTSQLLSDETQKNLIFGFSPDGKWLAYSPFSESMDAEFEQPSLILLSTVGEKVEHTLSTKDFDNELQVGHQFVGISGLSHWINANLIYVSFYSQNPNPNASGYISDLPKVVNPFSGEWNHQLLDLPERFSSTAVGISPDASRSLYFGNGLSLWDYERKIQIWHDETQTTPSRALIFWSPDSSTVAYANLVDPTEDQLLLITREGKPGFILNRTFPVPGIKIRSISWSPDSHYLALAGLDGDNLNILIYDVSLEKYISQCPVAIINDTWPSLIWSPESSHIAISQINSPIQILDVFSGDILELIQHGRVVGWSDKFPVVWP